MAYKFTRTIYKKIKKYDREDMEAFVQSVYLKGFNDGHNDLSKDKVITKLKEVSGFGEKTINKVIDCLFE